MRDPPIRARRRSPRAPCADAPRPRTGSPRRRWRSRTRRSTWRSSAGRARGPDRRTRTRAARAYAGFGDAARLRASIRRGVAESRKTFTPSSRRSTARTTSSARMSRQTHALQPAAPQVMALADLRPRDGQILGTPGTVALRACRSVEAHDRRSRRPRRCAWDPCRPTPSRRRRARAPGCRQSTSAARHGRRRRACETNGFAEHRCLAGPHSTTDMSPRRSRSAVATSAKREGGHRLLGQAAPGFRKRIAAAGPLASTAAPPPTRPDRAGTPGCRAAMPSGARAARG